MTVTELKKYEEVFSFQSLLKAHYLCRKDKTCCRNVVSFELDLGSRLAALEYELLNNEYKIKNYKQFFVYDPKKRKIECLYYRDRIVQMALCKNVIEPELEKVLLPSNCACRAGKGVDYAVKYLHKIMIRQDERAYILKCDIRKYFMNISHTVLYKLLLKFNLEPRFNAILKLIIDSYNKDTDTGIPLGNFTSQWFALLMLHPIDKMVTEIVGDNYVRYMDDFVIVCENKQKIQFILSKINELLAKLKLELNNKTQFMPIDHGVDFLGFRHRLISGRVVKSSLRSSSKNRLRRHLRELMWKLKTGQVGKEDVETRLCNYLAFMKDSAAAVSYYKKAIRNCKDKAILYDVIEHSKINLLRKTLCRRIMPQVRL
jgi:hypothetical protein